MISDLDVCPFFTKQHRLVDAAELWFQLLTVNFLHLMCEGMVCKADGIVGAADGIVCGVEVKG